MSEPHQAKLVFFLLRTSWVQRDFFPAFWYNKHSLSINYYYKVGWEIKLKYRASKKWTPWEEDRTRAPAQIESRGARYCPNFQLKLNNFFVSVYLLEEQINRLTGFNWNVSTDLQQWDTIQAIRAKSVDLCMYQICVIICI